jgi:hypothetical protein
MNGIIVINILDTNTSFVYGFLDIENKKLNIGLKTPNGKDKAIYITSIDNPEWWERYSHGLMERTVLYIGDEATAKTAEWFALDYGMKTCKERFYNRQNNAHCVDESLLTKDIKKTIIDFIEGRGNGIEYGTTDAAKAAKNQEIVMSISDRIDSGDYKVTLVPTTEVNKYKRIQVRVELVNQNTVSKIRARLLENPALARETFKPIAVVVMKNGEKHVVNGNTRLAAAAKTPGWIEVPVVYINESEFGSTKKIREGNYVRFGLYMNKEEFEIRVTNSKEDLKRNVENFLVQEKLDLSKPHHVDRARQLIYANFSYLCGSKQQLNGILQSILTDFEKNQAELRYQHNLITYGEDFFTKYIWDNYGENGVATIHATVSEAANAKPLAYICRVMKRTKLKKGAIILHYTSKQEIANEEQQNWIGDLRDTITYMKLPIVVDVLPHQAKD